MRIPRFALLSSAAVIVAGLIGGIPAPANAAAITVDTFDELKTAAAGCADGDTVSIGTAIDKPYFYIVEVACSMTLDLNGKSVTIGKINIAPGETLRIDDSSGTPGTLRCHPADYPNEAAIRTTGATLVVDGGSVVALGSRNGAGIGGNKDEAGGTVEINAGSVEARGTEGAGIGGGKNGDGGSTTINGGTVIAYSDLGEAAGIGGGADGAGGTTTINGGIVTAIGDSLGAGIGGGENGGGAIVTIGAGADVTVRGYNSIGAGAGNTTFGSLSVAGTLRIPADTLLHVPPLETVTIAATGVITGLTGPTDGGTILGAGLVDNAGTIPLPTSQVTVNQVAKHNYKVSFDSQGGSAAPDVTVFAKSFADGARTLPTPTRAGYTFDGWNFVPGGSGTDLLSNTTLPGSSALGVPEPITVYAQWDAEPLVGLAPTITGSAREGQTLTANEGPVTPASTTFTYQWKRYGTPIAGATNKTYKLTAADVGRKISVTVIASAPAQTDQILTSPLTEFVSSPNKRLILNTSTVKKGQSFNLIATGLKPKQTYIIWLSGKRSYIGFSDVNGMVIKAVKFPTTTKPGTRRVRVSGYTNGTRTFTVYTHVTYTK